MLMNSIPTEFCLIGRIIFSHTAPGGAWERAFAQARSVVEIHTGRGLYLWRVWKLAPWVHTWIPEVKGSSGK